MKKALFAAAIALLTVLSVAVSAPLMADNLKVQVLNSGAYSCPTTGNTVYTTWSVPTGGATVRAVKMWLGADLNIVADFGAVIWYNGPDQTGGELYREALDRYVNPIGLHSSSMSFSPDGVRVNAGANVSLAAYCTRYSTDGQNAHAIAHIYYTTP